MAIGPSMTATTNPASNITSEAAQLNAYTYLQSGYYNTVYFYFTLNGIDLYVGDKRNWSGDWWYSLPVTNLLPNTQYTFNTKIGVYDSNGTTAYMYGSQLTFTTLPAPIITPRKIILPLHFMQSNLSGGGYI